MNSVSLSLQAEADLISIWHYTKNRWGNLQAEKYLNLLLDEIEVIHIAASKSIVIGTGSYFVHKYEKHYIIFRSISNDGIYVVRVLHQQMNLEKHLKYFEQ